MNVESPSAREQGSPARQKAPVYAVVGVLLAAPFVALLWVSSYAKDSPRLFGFPFFYWYQFMWVLISAVLTLVAYLLVRRLERPRARLEHREGGPR